MRISDWSSDVCSSDLAVVERIGLGIAEALLERLILVEIEVARERGVAVAFDLVGEAVVLVLTIGDQTGQLFVKTDPEHALTVRIEGHIVAELRGDGDASLAIDRGEIGAGVSARRYNRHRFRPRSRATRKTLPANGRTSGTDR